MKCTLREWQYSVIQEELLIVQASTMDGRDGQTACPIGMGYSYVYHRGNPEVYQIGCHEKTVLCAFNPMTDLRRRKNAEVNRGTIMQTLAKHGIVNQTVEHTVYFLSLPMYKFVVSPEGNGIDAHRHYESIMAGCIPIIEESPLIRAKYGNAPILWTRDYSEITESYLLEKYEEMIDATWDFSSLFINSWSSCEQYMIRERGNYWCNKLTGEKWYK